MKLIDLLVQELPKRGGWPEYTLVITQDLEGELCLWEKIDPSCCNGYWGHSSGRGLQEYWCGNESMSIADDHASVIITREQYEAALAAAQQPVWNGEGLPPVGCECQAKCRDAENAEWFFFRCVGVDCGIAFGWAGKEAVTLGKGSFEFRPIRSEADKKRDAAIDALSYYTADCDAIDIYDAIAAGKIPGVKLDV